MATITETLSRKTSMGALAALQRLSEATLSTRSHVTARVFYSLLAAAGDPGELPRAMSRGRRMRGIEQGLVLGKVQV